jgi:hypothetical protein
MRGLVGAASLVCALLGVLVVVAAGGGQRTAARPCLSRISFGVLPVWARAGFSDPRPELPHVVGRSGRIAALVFGYPLLSPPSRVRANKILWAARVPPSTPSSLRIRAQRMQGTTKLGRPVQRLVVGGPGPSIIDLPAAGCWRFTLTWSGRIDTLDLNYRAKG